MNTTTKALAGSAAALLAMAVPSLAQSNDGLFSNTWTGDRSRHAVFVGVTAFTTPFEDASDFSSFPPGSSTDLGNSEAISFGYNYSINDHLDFQLALGTGFTSDLDSTGAFLAAAPTLGEVDIYPPQAYLIYNFQGPNAPFRTFVGVGAGYAITTGEDPTPEARALAGPDVDFEVSDEPFLGLTFGFEQKLTDALSARFQVNYNHVSVDTVLTSSALPVPVEQTVDVNPVLVTLGVAYRF